MNSEDQVRNPEVQARPTIRRFEACDLDAVFALEQATPEAPHWGRGEYERLLSADGTERSCVVAEVQGELRGFAVLRRIELSSTESIYELESIVVEVSARSRGLGGMLMEAALGIAAQSGAQRLELEVRASNAAAIRLYSRAGLRVEGRRRRYYSGPDEDAILMGKRL